MISIHKTVQNANLHPVHIGEAERIKRCRGRVFALRNEPEVARVWLPNADSPGLAMARAFGDFILKDFGLISVPDVSHHRLTEKDEFVVLATDGVKSSIFMFYLSATTNLHVFLKMHCSKISFVNQNLSPFA